MSADRSAALVASEVRERLYAAVQPFVEATIARLDPDARALALGAAPVEVDGKSCPCHIEALIQHTPAMLRVFVFGLPRAVELERFSACEVPGLAEALDAVLAGVLANLSRGHAAEVFVAASRPGGLIARFDLQTGDIRVLVAKADEDLGASIEVGSIVTRPETVH